MIGEINGFRYDSSKCTNCLSCQMACSFNNQELTNPWAAFIKIDFDYQTYENSVSFSNECINCGLCADYCRFGALTELQEVEANA